MFSALPPPRTGSLLPVIRATVAASGRKLVVLDDDPTGTQTVYDVPVLTRWDVDFLRREMTEGCPCFYVLTNSRSLTAEAARTRSLEIARNLRQASAAAHTTFTVVSRSDSTLRGHFPLETDALSEVLGPFDATFVIPYFEAGGRYTVHDTHYVADGDLLLPASATPFARDAAFGYRNSNLREWVQEKSAGRIPAESVASVSVSQLRADSIDEQAPGVVTAWLRSLPQDTTCIVNACHPTDMEAFALAALRAEQSGARFLYRTAADFVAARLGLAPRPLWQPLRRGGSQRSTAGGLVIVGSYVPKSSEQLQHLLDDVTRKPVELHVDRLLDDTTRDHEIAEACTTVAASLQAGLTTVVFTSREVMTGDSAAASLRIGERVSAALVEIVRQLPVRPRFLVAKGGITSSDIATEALQVERAIVAGQILPGVPVWYLGPEAKYPQMPYLVFPGNVGDAQALQEAVKILSQ